MATLDEDVELNRADYSAAGLLAVAAILCAAPLYQGGMPAGLPAAFAVMSGCVALIFFAALSAIWMDPLGRRRGTARVLSLLGAATLAGMGLAFSQRNPTFALLAGWVPAVLAAMAALALQRAHRQLQGKPAHLISRERFISRRRFSPRQ